MAAWFSENIGSIIVGLILLAIVAAVIRTMIKDKRSGRSSCGCGCANCAMSGSCHKSSVKDRS